ncbi:MAG: hypothetical protein IT488_13585 [Gammaproteobacteria bacterium]|nr:hypothetical protein [Gammaproteobacteria bacterium]
MRLSVTWRTSSTRSGPVSKQSRAPCRRACCRSDHPAVYQPAAPRTERNIHTGEQPPNGLPLDENGRERYNGGWAFAIDNDALLPTDNDYDYTGGLAFTLAGGRTTEWPWSLNPLAAWAEPVLFRHDAVEFNLHSQQIGLLAFTPDDLNNPQPVSSMTAPTQAWPFSPTASRASVIRSNRWTPRRLPWGYWV